MRRRIQAVPIPGASSSFAIGVTMTPLVTIPAITSTGSTGTTDPVGPLVFEAFLSLDDIGQGSGGQACSWIALMSGVGSGADVVWSIAWDDMDSDIVPRVFYGAFTDTTIGIVCPNVDVLWIDVTCTVNGIQYTSRIGKETNEEPGNYACSY